MAHTPGPWRYHADGDANHYSIIGPDGRWLVSLLHNGEKWAAEQEGNFRLIAAATELLNICRGIMRMPTVAAELSRIGHAAAREGKPDIWADLNTTVENAVHGGLRETCTHNKMVARKNDPAHAWECADCGYVYGFGATQEKPTLTRSQVRTLVALARSRAEDIAERVGKTNPAHEDAVNAAYAFIGEKP